KSHTQVSDHDFIQSIRGLSLNPAGNTQCWQGCLANATPAKWCDYRESPAPECILRGRSSPSAFYLNASASPSFPPKTTAPSADQPQSRSQNKRSACSGTF